MVAVRLEPYMRGVGEFLPRCMSIEIDQWAETRERRALFYKEENKEKKHYKTEFCKFFSRRF
jgi:hypothetical protein